MIKSDRVCKTNLKAGFSLEDRHLIDYLRLNKLLMIVALAFGWAYKIDIFQHKKLKTLQLKYMEYLKNLSLIMGLSY